MRTKTIILGAVAALALATLSANAGNAPHRSAQGSAMSLVAGTAAIAKADRAEVSAAVRTTTAVKTTAVKTTTAPAAQAEVEDEAEAPKGPVSPACQTAMDNLKALRQADATEDASEKANPTTTAADQAEDKTEADNLRNARTAVRTACLPQPSAACQTALASLKALRDADVAEDASEKAGQTSVAPESAAAKAEDIAEAQVRRAAEAAVHTACGGERD